MGTDILQYDNDAGILIDGNSEASDDERDKPTHSNSLDILVPQNIAGVDQFNTIIGFKDDTDLFDDVNLDAVTRIEQNKNDVDIVSSKNTVVRILNTTEISTTIADFFQSIV